MDDRNIPDIINSGYHRPKPRGAKGLVKEFILQRLQEGRLSDKEIAEECATLYEGSTSTKSVQWYKCKFIELGMLQRTSKHYKRRRFLTEFTYELVFLQDEPPNNVEVVTAKQLIDFAKQIILHYATTIPKELDEIVYDVRTAKHYLIASKKFNVIDQNNYDNPFEYVVENEEGTGDTDETV